MIYVLHVKTGHEMEICDALRQQYFGAMVPREMTLTRKDGKITQRERILFTGYVFVDMAIDLKIYYKIKAIPNVIKFLGGGKPLSLTAKEAEYIVWLNGGGKPLQPSEIETDGTVKTGPLKGREQNVISTNKRSKRARVRITLAGEPQEISLSFTSAEDSGAGEPDSNKTAPKE